ncbi:MAG TPA: hypothetical protein VFC30_06205 [Solirubrobacteraceae bacterium]|nr:hypothetical protein [Solirubrobacteraceae bacterium]
MDLTDDDRARIQPLLCHRRTQLVQRPRMRGAAIPEQKLDTHDHQARTRSDGRRKPSSDATTPVYYSSSRDFAVLDHRPADVAQVTQTFDADLHHRRLAPSTGSGELVWSPGARAPIGALIVHARRSLEVESEEMDDPTITRELCQAAQRGVRARVINQIGTSSSPRRERSETPWKFFPRANGLSVAHGFELVEIRQTRLRARSARCELWRAVMRR